MHRKNPRKKIVHKKKFARKKVHKIHPRKKNGAQKDLEKIVHKIHGRRKNSAQKNPRKKSA